MTCCFCLFYFRDRKFLIRNLPEVGIGVSKSLISLSQSFLAWIFARCFCPIFCNEVNLISQVWNPDCFLKLKPFGFLVIFWTQMWCGRDLHFSYHLYGPGKFYFDNSTITYSVILISINCNVTLKTHSVELLILKRTAHLK